MTRSAKPTKILITFCGIVLGGWGALPAALAQEAAGTPKEAGDGTSTSTPAQSLFPTNTPITVGTKTYQPEEISDFILPPGRSYLTREERKRLMETPGLKFVRAGAKGTPFYDVVRSVIEPWDDRQFRVSLWFENRLLPLADAEVIVEAGRKFKAERPENPGRAKSFPVWTTVAQPGLPSIRLFPGGWSMTIQKVQRIGPLGEPSRSVSWRAWVTVRPIIRDEYYEQAQAVMDSHDEVYFFQDGKLTLEEEHPDPKRTSDPMKGIRASFKGRTAPIQVGPPRREPEV